MHSVLSLGLKICFECIQSIRLIILLVVPYSPCEPDREVPCASASQLIVSKQHKFTLKPTDRATT